MKAKTGDMGQRYQVEGLGRDSDKWEVVGWTESEDGGSLAEGVRFWPKFKDVRVTDRSPQAAGDQDEVKG